MPIIEQSPDIDPNEFKAQYPTDRRAASKKQDDSVMHSQWPVVTHAVFTALARGGEQSKTVGEVNMTLKRLCAARSHLANALMFIDGSLKDYNPKTNQTAHAKKIWAKLRSVRDKIETQLGNFPLEIR